MATKRISASNRFANIKPYLTILVPCYIEMYFIPLLFKWVSA